MTIVVHPRVAKLLEELRSATFAQRSPHARLESLLEKEMYRQRCFLLPTNGEESGLFESVDVGDIGHHVRCRACQQSDFTAYHIFHAAECPTAERLRASIAALTAEQRRELYRGTEHL